MIVGAMKILLHFRTWVATAMLFTAGVVLFILDFFRSEITESESKGRRLRLAIA